MALEVGRILSFGVLGLSILKSVRKGERSHRGQRGSYSGFLQNYALRARSTVRHRTHGLESQQPAFRIWVGVEVVGVLFRLLHLEVEHEACLLNVPTTFRLLPFPLDLTFTASATFSETDIVNNQLVFDDEV